MAGVAELDQLQGLLHRLDAIARATPGSVIRADDWNTLVAVVVDIARAALASSDTEGVAPHEHVEQVSIGWLAPSLRALVERGPLGDPAASARVDALARLSDRLVKRADAADTEVERVRASVGDAATREVERQSRLARVQSTVEQIDTAGQDVLELRSSLNDLGAKVGRVLEVGAQLTVDGQAVDVGAIARRVDSLDAFREQLRQPSGELLDAAAVSRELADLRSKIPLAQPAAGGGRLTDAERSELVERAKAAIAEQVDASIERGRETIRVEVTSRLAAIDQVAARAVADALPAEGERIRSALRQEIATATGAVRDEAAERFEARVAEAVEAVQQRFEERLGRERADIRAEQETRIGVVRDELDSRASVRERDIEVRLATGNDARLEASRSQITAFITSQRQEVAATRQDIAAVQQEVSTQRQDLAVVKDQIGGHTRRLEVFDVRQTQFEAQVTRANPTILTQPQRVTRPNP